MSTEPLDVGFITEELEANEIDSYTLSNTDYSKLFASYLYNNELCSAKFLWRRMPDNNKSTPELQRLWSIGKALWSKKYAQANELINYKWPESLESIMVALKRRIQQDTLKFISVYYDAISFRQFQSYMGIDKDQAERIIESEGWLCENGFVVPMASSEPEQGLSSSNEILDRLVRLASFTTYVEN